MFDKIAPFKLANYVEAGFWTTLGIAFAIAAIRRRGNVRRDCLIASFTLVLFGLSDVVEADTGAWWRPWWLLFWKGVCVLILLLLAIRAIQSSRGAAGLEESQRARSRDADRGP
jgi:hypothetical protein